MNKGTPIFLLAPAFLGLLWSCQYLHSSRSGLSLFVILPIWLLLPQKPSLQAAWTHTQRPPHHRSIAPVRLLVHRQNLSKSLGTWLWFARFLSLRPWSEPWDANEKIEQMSSISCGYLRNVSEKLLWLQVSFVLLQQGCGKRLSVCWKWRLNHEKEATESSRTTALSMIEEPRRSWIHFPLDRCLMKIPYMYRADTAFVF